MEKNKSDFYLQVKQVGALTAIPILLVVGPLLGFYAGDWADRKFQLHPWFTIAGLIGGFVAAGREIYRLTDQFLKDSNKK